MAGPDVVSPPEAVLGQIPTGTTLHRELAAAARSRGRTASIRTELIGLRERLASTAAPAVDLDSARRRVADAGGEEERLKEQIAALRGDVRARRSVDADATETLAELESTAAALARAQTDRIAAEQALDSARGRAERVRDVRERRLKLRDQVENRRRDARRELARTVYPAFRGALSVVPGVVPDDAGTRPSTYDGPRLAASLAAVRIAELDGPVAVGESAAAWVAEHGGEISVATVIDAEAVDRHGAPVTD
ncbi:hypothetical protein [Halorubrum sp. BV1]|uniref:DUF7856 family protein n=1 Tax=Halorubrum sp. BV1 TaxID=1498500 RepID=UPI0009B5AAB0|nr:hypothetical protein [Halorubrum sp. BV1]